MPRTDPELNQLLENLSKNIEPNVDNDIYDFLIRSREILKNRDVYCFRPKIYYQLKAYAGILGEESSDFLEMIHPLPDSDFAWWITLSKITKQSEIEALLGIKNIIYRIEIIRFDLTRTAGNTVDLAIIRGEVIPTWETEENIRKNGILKGRDRTLKKEYSVKKYGYWIGKFLNLFSKNNSSQALQEKICPLLEHLENGMKRHLKNPSINRFTTRQAINY